MLLLKTCVTEVNSTVYQYQKIQNEIEDLTKNNELLLTQKELLSHQLNELLQIDMTQDELDSIEDDYRVSVNASLLVEKISKILESLDQ